MNLKDKVAIVTGSSRGIGAATVKELARNGAKVVVNYIEHREAGEKVLDGIKKSGGTGILVRADVTAEPQVRAMVDRTVDELGPVDILVNNAGANFPLVPFTEFSWDAFEAKILGEFKAIFHCCRAVVPHMTESGGGSIVNISSTLSRQTAPGFVAHSTAKSGMDGFTRALAAELGSAGIRVNTVAPGLTETDATAHTPQEMKDAILEFTPLERIGQPDDVAGAVLFLCSDAARFVTGTYLPVSGGAMMI